MSELPKGGRVAKAAGILCNDPQFCRWLDRKRRYIDGTHGAEMAAEWLRGACKVKSRAQLDTDEYGARMFRKIVLEYQAENPPAKPIGDPKRYALELPRLLELAKIAPCARCTREDNTVVACHYQGPRSHAYGKGWAIKPDDTFVAFLCASCHALLDSYRNGDNDLARSEEFLHLIALTHNWVFRNGHAEITTRL